MPPKKRPKELFEVTYDYKVGKSTCHGSFNIEARGILEARRMCNDWYLEQKEPRPTNVKVRKAPKPDGYNGPVGGEFFESC